MIIWLQNKDDILSNICGTKLIFLDKITEQNNNKTVGIQNTITLRTVNPVNTPSQTYVRKKVRQQINLFFVTLYFIPSNHPCAYYLVSPKTTNFT